MQVHCVAFDAMLAVGMTSLWRRVNRRRIPILMLHGLEPARADGDGAPIRPRLPAGDFDRYVRLLSRHFHFISLDAAADMLSGLKRPEPYCLALTFDDAYLSNATDAWPILKKYGATATFFLPTAYIGTGRIFWADRLDYAVRRLRLRRRFLTVGRMWWPVPSDGREAEDGLFWKIKNTCMAAGWRKAHEVVQAIEALAEISLADSIHENRWAAFMTWDHVRSMQKDGACFASHTVGHRMLDRLCDDEAMRELKDSKDEIERRTSAPCKSVAYPRGRYTPAVVNMAREAGYRNAVTTDEKLADAADPPMMLPRIGIPGRAIPSAELLARATGLSGALSRLRRAL